MASFESITTGTNANKIFFDTKGFPIPKRTLSQLSPTAAKMSSEPVAGEFVDAREFDIKVKITYVLTAGSKPTQRQEGELNDRFKQHNLVES